MLLAPGLGGCKPHSLPRPPAHTQPAGRRRTGRWRWPKRPPRVPGPSWAASGGLGAWPRWWGAGRCLSSRHDNPMCTDGAALRTQIIAMGTCCRLRPGRMHDPLEGTPPQKAPGATRSPASSPPLGPHPAPRPGAGASTRWCSSTACPAGTCMLLTSHTQPSLQDACLSTSVPCRLWLRRPLPGTAVVRPGCRGPSQPRPRGSHFPALHPFA